MSIDGTLIALTGAAGCGKDSIADVLVREHGFKSLAFADALRKMARDIDPVIGWDDDGPLHLDAAIDAHGYEHVKRNYPEARRFLQRLGTEGIRKNVRDTWWVDVVHDALSEDAASRYVITDCRFENEADMIRQLEGWVVHVFRPGLEPLPGDHASESGVPFLNNLDIRLLNGGTLEELSGTVADLIHVITA